jgi:hypothetical protein
MANGYDPSELEQWDRLKGAQLLENAENRKQDQFMRSFQRGGDAEKALRIRQFINNNPNKFRRRVYGPVALELNVRDEQKAAMVEKAVGRRMMMAFVTECDADRKAFVRHIEGDLRILGVSLYNIENGTFHVQDYNGNGQRAQRGRLQRPYTPARFAELQRYGVVAYMDELFDCPDAVKYMLCNNSSLHAILAGDQRAETALAKNEQHSPLRRMLADKSLKASTQQGHWRLSGPKKDYSTTISRFGDKEPIESAQDMPAASVLQTQLGGSDVHEQRWSRRLACLDASTSLACKCRRCDKGLLLAYMAQYRFAFQYASEELKGDREVVLAAVAQNYFALQYASEELKGDKEVVLAAVAQGGRALQYASKELKGDKEV